MRRAGVLLLLASCTPDPPPKTVAAPSATAPRAAPEQDAGPTRIADCLTVAQDGAGPTGTVEGTVAAGKDGLFMMRLKKPRCVVGLPGATFISEVALASTGFDLRPLVGARIRAHGEAIAGQTDLGGPAVVVLVKDVDRVPLDEPGP